MTDEAVVQKFLDTAAQCNAITTRVADMEELNSVLESIVGPDSVVYCPAATETERAVTVAGDRRTDDYVNADICIEEVFGAVAETGSLVCTSANGRTVQAGLLPPHHVAVVSADHVAATLDDLFARFGNEIPTNIALETGPSRTADIELTLTIGVHGPERLSIIVLSSS